MFSSDASSNTNKDNTNKDNSKSSTRPTLLYTRSFQQITNANNCSVLYDEKKRVDPSKKDHDGINPNQASSESDAKKPASPQLDTHPASPKPKKADENQSPSRLIKGKQSNSTDSSMKISEWSESSHSTELDSIDPADTHLLFNMEWEANSDYFRQQIIAWHQSQFQMKIIEMILILDTVLRNPQHYLYNIDPFTKKCFLFESENQKEPIERYYSYFDILEQLCLTLRSCRETCYTSDLFQLEIKSSTGEHLRYKAMEEKFNKSRHSRLLFPKEKIDEKKQLLRAFLQQIGNEAALEKDMAYTQVHFLESLSKEQQQDSKFSTIVPIEAAKETLLRQAARDLLEINKRFSICPAKEAFCNIRHLTLAQSSAAAAEINSNSQYGFMDLLTLFTSVDMPQLESIVIEHVAEHQRLLLGNLIAVLVAKNKSLIIRLGCDFPEKERVLFTPYEQKYHQLIVQRMVPPPPAEPPAPPPSLSFFLNSTPLPELPTDDTTQLSVK